ncbi:hypothetical protein [Cupriavidus taiwanensis]|uniref:hypothetical protein n=1 Tax=Cupriavidus taiwanensis TaxID=164546 RepID=UPI0039C1C431
MKGIIRSLMAWWQSKCSDPLPPIRMPVMSPTLAGVRSPDVLASRALLLAAVSVPRRPPVSRVAPSTSASRWRALEEGMSMLPAAMLLASYSCDGAAADEGSFGLRDAAPVASGGGFDGGGASGNWDSGGSDPASSFSSD